MKKMLLVITIVLITITYLSFQYINNNQVMVAVSQQLNDPNLSSLNTLKVMTYNIRHGKGLDNRIDLSRIASLIKESGADIIGLNEVDVYAWRSDFKNQIKELAEILKMNYSFGPTINIGIGKYGNAILSRYPISFAKNQILPSSTRLEKRGLLTTRITVDNKSVYVMTTHLSLNQLEQRKQIKWIEGYLQDLEHPFILMGDFNSEVRTDFLYSPLIRDLNSYPAENASREIDLIFSNLDYVVEEGYTIDSIASDHLPVIIKISQIVS